MQNFDVTELEPQTFAYLERTAPMDGIGATMGGCFEELGKAFATSGVAPAGPPLTHYLRYNDKETTFDVGFPVRPADAEKLQNCGLEIGKTQAGRVMKAVHVGSYDTLMRTYNAVMEEMAARKLKPTADMWESYMSPPETPAEQTRTEVIWPIVQAA